MYWIFCYKTGPQVKVISITSYREKNLRVKVQILSTDTKPNNPREHPTSLYEKKLFPKIYKSQLKIKFQFIRMLIVFMASNPSIFTTIRILKIFWTGVIAKSKY
jgi:hypothetical protein